MNLNAHQLSCIRQDRMIFRDISFSLELGNVLWVKGRNGAGKSSLLRIIAGLLKPAAGEIRWSGKNVSDEPEVFQGQFIYIGHQEPLKPVLTATENLKFWARFSGNADVRTALQEFELEAIADNPVRIMSAGQKKRTNLARLVACPAPLWILDEPVSSLDSHYIDLFRGRLEKHIKAGGMALLATHQDLGLENIRILDLDDRTEEDK